MNGAEYGFEEGEDHSLHSFRRRADAFKRQWLKDHPLPDSKGKGREVPSEPAMDVDGAVLAEQIAIEDHFEREFWRLVESQNESVEIEYGADVNHTRDGGFVWSLSCLLGASADQLMCRFAVVFQILRFILTILTLEMAGTSTISRSLLALSYVILNLIFRV